MPATTRVVQIDPAPMPDLHRARPGLDQRLGCRAGGHVARNDVDGAVEGLPHPAHGLDDALRVPVRGVDHERVDVRGDERLGALHRVLGGAHRGRDAKAAEFVLARGRVLDRLLNVLDRDEALEPVVLVDDEQLLDLVTVQDLAGVLERGADGDGHQVGPGHHVCDGAVQFALEPQVTVREDADQPSFLGPVLGDRHAGDPVAPHQFVRIGELVVRRERDRVDDHAALRPLHAIDLRGLFLDREVLVDDAEAALLGEGDGHRRLGHGVHGRAQQRESRARCSASRASRRPPGSAGPSSAAGPAGRRRTSGPWPGRPRSRPWRNLHSSSS